MTVAPSPVSKDTDNRSFENSTPTRGVGEPWEQEGVRCMRDHPREREWGGGGEEFAKTNEYRRLVLFTHLGNTGLRLCK